MTRRNNGVSDFICPGDERTDGRVCGRAFPLLSSYHGGTQANRVIHRERSTGVGSDGVTEMVLRIIHI